MRVPYLHCKGAACTQILHSMDTNTLRDTQKILKNIFSNFFWLTVIFNVKKSSKYRPHAYIYLIPFKFEIKLIFIVFQVLMRVRVHLENTHEMGTQCGCEYGYKNYESFGSLVTFLAFLNITSV